jgi:hypothetical protein
MTCTDGTVTEPTHDAGGGRPVATSRDVPMGDADGGREGGPA